MAKEQEIQEVCRLIDIRDENIRKAEAKGAFERTPTLKLVLSQADAAQGEKIKYEQITEDEVLHAYRKRPSPRLSDHEVRAAYHALVEAARLMSQEKQESPREPAPPTPSRDNPAFKIGSSRNRVGGF